MQIEHLIEKNNISLLKKILDLKNKNELDQDLVDFFDFSNKKNQRYLTKLLGVTCLYERGEIFEILFKQINSDKLKKANIYESLLEKIGRYRLNANSVISDESKKIVNYLLENNNKINFLKNDNILLNIYLSLIFDFKSIDSNADFFKTINSYIIKNKSDDKKYYSDYIFNLAFYTINQAPYYYNNNIKNGLLDLIKFVSQEINKVEKEKQIMIFNGLKNSLLNNNLNNFNKIIFPQYIQNMDINYIIKYNYQNKNIFSNIINNNNYFTINMFESIYAEAQGDKNLHRYLITNFESYKILDEKNKLNKIIQCKTTNTPIKTKKIKI
jgi:hypothetical protein